MNHSNEKNLECKQRLRLVFVFHFFPRLLIACVRVASLVSSFDMVAAGSPSLTFKMPLYNSPCMIIAATDTQGDIQGQVTDTRDTHTPDYEKHVNLCPCLCACLCPLRTVWKFAGLAAVESLPCLVSFCSLFFAFKSRTPTPFYILDLFLHKYLLFPQKEASVIVSAHPSTALAASPSRSL
jgi:hypothetical protein